MSKNLKRKYDVEYVAGFYFSADNTQVALVEKTNPTWQNGKLNGIGGRCLAGEEHSDAMPRKFFEKTGVHYSNWKYYCSLTGLTVDQKMSWRVKFYYGNGDLTRLKQTADEIPAIYEVRDLLLDNVEAMPDLRWLLLMAISLKGENRNTYAVEEVYQERD